MQLKFVACGAFQLNRKGLFYFILDREGPIKMKSDIWT